MSAAERLQAIGRLFLDTAPIIYFVEKDQRYAALLRSIFDRIDEGSLVAVTSPVTLAECLVLPFRAGLPGLAEDFAELIVSGNNTVFAPIEQEVATRSAELRAQYNLSLMDAFQVAVALATKCEGFLTNDTKLKRVSGVDVLVLKEMSIE